MTNEEWQQRVLDGIKERDEKKAEYEKLTLEQLLALEEDIIKKKEEAQKKAEETEWDVPEEGYKKAAEALHRMLSKVSVNWNMATIMYEMFNLWSPDKKPDKMEYAAFDATLRQLNSIEYKGYEELSDVVTVNEYFKNFYDKYQELTLGIHFAAQEHSNVLEAIQKKPPIGKA